MIVGLKEKHACIFLNLSNNVFVCLFLSNRDICGLKKKERQKSQVQSSTSSIQLTLNPQFLSPFEKASNP